MNSASTAIQTCRCGLHRSKLGNDDPLDVCDLSSEAWLNLHLTLGKQTASAYVFISRTLERLTEDNHGSCGELAPQPGLCDVIEEEVTARLESYIADAADTCV